MHKLMLYRFCVHARNDTGKEDDSNMFYLISIGIKPSLTICFLYETQGLNGNLTCLHIRKINVQLGIKITGTIEIIRKLLLL